MIKRFRRSAVAMIASSAFLANGAWAALDQSTSNADFADSLFGPGSEAIVIDPNGDAVVTVTTDAVVGNGNVADLTIDISGGEFSGIVPLSSISVSAGVVAFTKTDGGNPGDTTVTFEMDVVVSLPIGTTIDFEVPSLTNVDLSSPTSAVVAVSAIVPTTTAPDPFPNTIDTNDCTLPADCTIAVSSSPYTAFDLGSGDTGQVQIDDRPVIDIGGTTIDTTPGVAGGSREGLLIGEHDLDLDIAPPLQRDGDPFSLATGGDGVGSVTLVATGNFRAGDIVFIDVNGNTDVDTGESFVISGGTATSLPIPADTAEGLGVLDVYYVPNEVDDLSPEVFGLTATINYVLATNQADAATPPTPPGEIEYDNINFEGYAYGVVRAGGTDRSFVRVTNETSGPASIFFSCTDDAGNSSFGDFGVLGGNETEAYDSDEIGTLLGGVVFSGRGACDILSDENISTQHKIRSSDILTDNSVVIGLPGQPD
jgi:hypothetical protein